MGSRTAFAAGILVALALLVLAGYVIHQSRRAQERPPAAALEAPSSRIPRAPADRTEGPPPPGAEFPTPAPTASASRVDFQAGDATVRGTVGDEQGQAIAGATILLITESPPSPAEYRASATTARDGTFELSRVPGLSEGTNYILRCEAHRGDRKGRAEIPLPLGPGEQKHVDLLVPLSGPATVSGGLSHPGGAIGGVTVTLYSETFEARATANPQGRFELRGVPLGSYALRVTHEDAASGAFAEVGRSSVEVNRPLVSESFVLSVASVELTITAPSGGGPVGGATVDFLVAESVMPNVRVLRRIATGRTDSQGVLWLPYVLAPDEPVEVRVHGRPTRPASLMLAPRAFQAALQVER